MDYRKPALKTSGTPHAQPTKEETCGPLSTHDPPDLWTYHACPLCSAELWYACINEPKDQQYMFAHVRYKAARDVLFGNRLDLASRFDMKDENEKGTILLNKIFDTYQAPHK